VSESAARQLDRDIDDALAGREGGDAAVRSLVEMHHDEPPPALVARIGATVRRAERRRWLPVQIAAAWLGLLLVGQGIGNLANPDWVAGQLGEPSDSHAYFEGGVLLLVLGGLVLAGALRRRRLGVAVLAGAPVGLVFALNGLGELSEVPAGGLLHVSQGLAAIALVALWWRARRYVLPRHAKNPV
jgi:MYXO-CTERM domain-containing protein